MKRTTLSRRGALKLIGGTALASGLGFPTEALAADRATVINYGFVLGIHCPPTRGLVEECPKLGLDITLQRFQKGRDIVQTIIGGSGDMAVSGPITALRSVQAGHPLTIFGNYYLHTDLVLAVNTDHIKSWSDFMKHDVTVGINSQGDITQVMIIGGMKNHGVDPQKVQWADIGGSGSRMRALIAKRIQAATVHFEQVPKLQKTGNYKVMLEPSKAYHPWVNEVVYTRSDWLEKDHNRRKAVELMKGIIIAERKATKSYEYYKQSFLKYATLKGKDKMPDSAIHDEWNTLANVMGVWPATNDFKRSNFENLMPYYVAAKAVENKPFDWNKVVDTSIVADALKQLG